MSSCFLCSVLKARSWELRTACDLARLWQHQGRGAEALQLVQTIYDQFTEGFDTADLRDAKALLAELELTACMVVLS